MNIFRSFAVYWYAGWVPTQQWEEFLKKEEDKKKKREENDDETFWSKN